MCIHGFRAIASTLLNKQGFRSDVIEAQLATCRKIRYEPHTTAPFISTNDEIWCKNGPITWTRWKTVPKNKRCPTNRTGQVSRKNLPRNTGADSIGCATWFFCDNSSPLAEVHKKCYKTWITSDKGFSVKGECKKSCQAWQPFFLIFFSITSNLSRTAHAVADKPHVGSARAQTGFSWADLCERTKFTHANVPWNLDACSPDSRHIT